MCIWRVLPAPSLQTTEIWASPKVFPTCRVQGSEMGWWCSAQRGPKFRFTSARQEGGVHWTRRRKGFARGADETKDRQQQICKQWVGPSDAQKRPQGCFFFRSAEYPQSSQPSNFRSCRRQRGWKRVISKKPLLGAEEGLLFGCFTEKGIMEDRPCSGDVLALLNPAACGGLNCFLVSFRDKKLLEKSSGV